MNIIDAIINLVNNPVLELKKTYKSNNRANNTGDALEEYIKDLYAGTFNTEEKERLEIFNRNFSYLGNASNPPDLMIKNGDAIEVKKIETAGSELALNSSYPKQKLTSNSSMINKACQTAEEWTEKDVIYAIGVVKKDKLKQLCFVYGLDYCACDEVYSNIKTKIKNGVEKIPGIEFEETKELGKIKKIDPLGITYLRVRGMWGIKNPWAVFNYVYKIDIEKDFNFMCIINEEKWGSLVNNEKLVELSKINNNLKISEIRIKNPDNPAKLKNAKLIEFEK